jgi:hypothetical protein
VSIIPVGAAQRSPIARSDGRAAVVKRLAHYRVIVERTGTTPPA